MAETSSFDNNDQIVALPTGGFAVSPFGRPNFVEAYGSDGDFAWAVAYPSGTDFPTGMAVSAENNRIVVVSRNVSGGSRSTAIVNLGIRRQLFVSQ